MTPFLLKNPMFLSISSTMRKKLGFPCMNTSAAKISIHREQKATSAPECRTLSFLLICKPAATFRCWSSSKSLSMGCKGLSNTALVTAAAIYTPSFASFSRAVNSSTVGAQSPPRWLTTKEATALPSVTDSASDHPADSPAIAPPA